VIDLGAIVKRVQKTAADNSPMILTALGVTGLVTTAILTGQATFKYMEVLSESGYYDRDYKFERSTKEHVEQSWKYYIPAVGTGAFTIACIIAANRIQTRRAAALASAYTISQELFKEYRAKVIDKVGEKKEQEVREEVAKDRAKKNPPQEIVIVGKNDVLCYDMFSGRYFYSTLENLKKAENDTNYTIIHHDYCSLTDYWDKLGLSKTQESDEIGWNTDSKLMVEYSSTIAEDGRPCITIGLQTIPIRGYWSVYH
jgi:Family of unknown function (DUF6353)